MVSEIGNVKNPLRKLKGMSLNRRLALVVLAIAAFIFLTLLLLFTYALPQGYSIGPLEIIAQYHLEFMFLVSLLGVMVGAFIVYLLYEKIEIKEAESGITADMLLSFLSNEDRKIVEYLVKSRGSCYQSELGRLEGMTRLRAHRALFRLEHKGIVALEKVGKTNRIMLVEPLYHALSLKMKESA